MISSSGISKNAPDGAALSAAFTVLLFFVAVSVTSVSHLSKVSLPCTAGPHKPCFPAGYREWDDLEF